MTNPAHTPRPDVVYYRTGGRRIELYVPFPASVDNKQVTVETIDIGPVTADFVDLFMNGRWASSYGMVAFLCGHRDESIVRKLRYPDVDRVFGAFLDMLPTVVRERITNGEIPQPGTPAPRRHEGPGQAPEVIPPGPQEPVTPAGYGDDPNAEFDSGVSDG